MSDPVIVHVRFSIGTEGPNTGRDIGFIPEGQYKFQKVMILQADSPGRQNLLVKTSHEDEQRPDSGVSS
jgi:hypothetical protein